MEKCDKKETIIQAALELVAEHGFHGAPMAMIARRLGLEQGPFTVISTVRTP
ncbi:TetR/AcrR family transcriptional regulator [Geotalea toluenoxydans]|uniref:TetR/AcrR family transcriptional regulator n=1 Tax=Geotalea toluenoxydans TaxID=421624 RepID=UPI000A8D01CA|nr:helix-turn-helix domain containing protein [Geotalea toluenoxydans]